MPRGVVLLPLDLICLRPPQLFWPWPKNACAWSRYFLPFPPTHPHVQLTKNWIWWFCIHIFGSTPTPNQLGLSGKGSGAQLKQREKAKCHFKGREIRQQNRALFDTCLNVECKEVACKSSLVHTNKNLLLFVICHKFSRPGIQCSKEEENDIEEDEGFDITNRNSCLDVQLCQSSLPCNYFSNYREDDAQLSQSSHKQLIRLCESK